MFCAERGHPGSPWLEVYNAPRPPCRCQKASSAAPAKRRIPKAGNAVRTAGLTRCAPAMTARSANTCSGNCRSSSSAPARRTTDAKHPAAAASRGPMGNRSSNRSGDATDGRSGLHEAAARRHTVRPSNSGQPSNRPPLPSKESAQAAVAAVAAEQAAAPRGVRNRTRIRTPGPPSRGHRANRALRVRLRLRVRIFLSPGKKEAHRVPKVMVRSGGDGSDAAGVVAAALQPRKESGYVDSNAPVAVTDGSTAGRFIRRWRAVHSPNPSQRIQ